MLFFNTQGKNIFLLQQWKDSEAFQVVIAESVHEKYNDLEKLTEIKWFLGNRFEEARYYRDISPTPPQPLPHKHMIRRSCTFH
jgi:hypothetical protein